MKIFPCAAERSVVSYPSGMKFSRKLLENSWNRFYKLMTSVIFRSQEAPAFFVADFWR